MYALKVQLNDRPPVVGGATDLGVLSAILTCAGRLGPVTVPRRQDESVDFTFRLGGLTARQGSNDEHLVWLENNELKVGDRLVVEIVEVERVDPVIGESPAEREEDEREYYEHCKRAYLELRAKYEIGG